MRCDLVHALPGRVRVRVDEPIVFNGLAPRFARFLTERPGVRTVRLSADARSVVVTYDGETSSANALLTTLRELDVAALGTEDAEADAPPNAGDSLLPLGLATAALVSTGTPFGVACLAGAALPIFRRAAGALWEKGKLNVDVLDAAATGVLALQGSLRTAGIMVWLVALGDFIRDLTVQQSHRAVRDLFDGRTRAVWIVRGGEKIHVPVADILEGDEVVVYGGELIPVDGTVLSGTALVDQKLVTGESVPVEKSEGDGVYAATAVSDGKLYLRAATAGRETVAAKVVRFVRHAPLRETRVQNYAEAFADRVVPWSFLAAGASFLGTGDPGRAASLLIIDFGTGIRIAAPTTVLASIARAARRGILVKGGRYLEQLATVDAVIFDKTATLTTGTPTIVDAVAFDGFPSADAVLALAAGAERRLTHPVAKAIVRAARARRLAVPERERSEYAIGLGVAAWIDGAPVHVGCERFLAQTGVDVDGARDRLRDIEDRAASPVFVARDGRLVGLLAYADPLRREAPDVVRALADRGVRDIVMVTGDHAPVAADVARHVGITRWVADAFPEQKLQVLRALQAEGRRVAVVGDGINDSPALVHADVGIAVRGGTDVAHAAAHVALLEGSLWKLVQAIDIGRDAARLIRQNWDLVFYPNAAAIGLALLGAIGPIGTTIISNGSGIVASLNALRPLLGTNGRVREARRRAA